MTAPGPGRVFHGLVKIMNLIPHQEAATQMGAYLVTASTEAWARCATAKASST